MTAAPTRKVSKTQPRPRTGFPEADLTGDPSDDRTREFRDFGALPSAAVDAGADDDRLASPVTKTWTSPVRRWQSSLSPWAPRLLSTPSGRPSARAFEVVRNLAWDWAAAASLFEVLSMPALALLYQALLQANQARLTMTWILAASYTANAISVRQRAPRRRRHARSSRRGDVELRSEQGRVPPRAKCRTNPEVAHAPTALAGLASWRAYAGHPADSLRHARRY